MIATHNIKVNGRWILAGEEYEPEAVVTPEKAEEAERKPEKQEAPVETTEKKAEEKPKTASRRKKISE